MDAIRGCAWYFETPEALASMTRKECGTFIYGQETLTGCSPTGWKWWCDGSDNWQFVECVGFAWLLLFVFFVLFLCFFVGLHQPFIVHSLKYVGIEPFSPKALLVGFFFFFLKKRNGFFDFNFCVCCKSRSMKLPFLQDLVVIWAQFWFPSICM